MNKINKIYNNYIVKKPWGEEYTIFNNRNKLAVTLVKIKPKKMTSLHCHPTKKTGFIILKGNPSIQIGIHDKNTWKSKPLSILVIRPGLFHSIKNLNNSQTIVALEFETPYLKKDLIRLKDTYGRTKKGYETKKFMKKLTNKDLKFKMTKSKKIYNLYNKKIIIEKIRNRNQILKFNNKSVTAILDGNLTDKKKQIVLSYGEIIKTTSLKILTKHYKINKPFLAMNII
tara:strand:+ start:515 stop:1198 length:684 start_codon:yes stop_codon:yes gene_type:complete